MKLFNLMFVFLCFFRIEVSGQELNFDQTVNYLNEKLAFFSTHNGIINVTKQGDVDIYFEGSAVNFRFNLFEVDFIEAKRKKEVSYLNINCKEKKCELFKLYNSEGNNMIDQHNTLALQFTRKSQVSKIIKAFEHLKKLCDPESDPF